MLGRRGAEKKSTGTEHWTCCRVVTVTLTRLTFWSSEDKSVLGHSEEEMQESKTVNTDTFFCIILLQRGAKKLGSVGERCRVKRG